MEQKQEKKLNYPIREQFIKEFVSRMISQGYAKEVIITKVMGSLKDLQGWKEPSQNPRFVPIKVQNQFRQRFPVQNQQTSFQQIPMQQTSVQKIPNQQTTSQQVNTQQIQQSSFPVETRPQKPLYMLKPLTGQSQQTMRRPALNQPPRQMPPQRAMATQKQKQEYQPSIASQKELLLPRILPILNDPTAFSIECSGPEKPLLINRHGSIQASQITLNAEEIKSVLQEISNRTRIPLITGTFKAAFDNFICTAVISDFISSRFIIQKKPNTIMFPQQFR